MTDRCIVCDGTRWVCEAHPDRPWGDSAKACTCGAPGDPCAACNPAGGIDEPPAPPRGFRVTVGKDGDRH